MTSEIWLILCRNCNSRLHKLLGVNDAELTPRLLSTYNINTLQVSFASTLFLNPRELFWDDSLLLNPRELFLDDLLFSGDCEWFSRENWAVQWRTGPGEDSPNKSFLFDRMTMQRGAIDGSICFGLQEKFWNNVDVADAHWERWTSTRAGGGNIRLLHQNPFSDVSFSALFLLWLFAMSCATGADGHWGPWLRGVINLSILLTIGLLPVATINQKISTCFEPTFFWAQSHSNRNGKEKILYRC